MDRFGLRVTPTVKYGRSRLYVSLPGGRNAAWYDRDTHRVSLVLTELRDEVLAALAPYLTGDFTVGPPPVPTADELARLALRPDDDLAPNRPGEALHLALDRRAQGTAGRRHLRADPRIADLDAQQRLGAELDRLENAGWRVLHSVPLPGAEHIDHLAIGPAGVFAVRTLAARGRRVRVADPLVTTGRAEPRPELRRARRGAQRASFALAVAVRPVLAVVGAARLDVPPVPGDVRILADTEVPALSRLDGVLKPADIEALHGRARDRRTWLRT
ncbi:nuclease-related domain-containing protein [Streptomyces sp. NPDC002133]|uniref:nuclease-related domain-containing protein n=1 Tax=Streptomyces sp. NPDC002133 TaxID=3154409 RepID=UPI00331F771C